MLLKPCYNSELSREIRENINGLQQELQDIHTSLIELNDEVGGVFQRVVDFGESMV